MVWIEGKKMDTEEMFEALCDVMKADEHNLAKDV